MTEDDLNAFDLNRLTDIGPVQIPPLQKPGQASRNAAADQFMRMGPLDAAPGGAVIDKRELPRARALAQVLAQLIQNTNLTAALPAHVSPPLWSVPVDLVDSVTIPAAVMPQYQTVLRYTAPPGNWARIANYGVLVRDEVTPYLYDGSLQWRIQVNGANVQTLADWTDQRGSITQPRDTVITLREGWVVTFDVQRIVAAGEAQVVTMGLNGWQWRNRWNYEGTKAVLTAT